MRRGVLAVLGVLLCLSLSGCGRVLPRQTDAASEAILRVMILERDGEELTVTALTAGAKTGESDESPEQVEGTGADYREAKGDIESKREVSLTHATEWLVNEEAVHDLLGAFLEDTELTFEARVFLIRQSTEEVTGAFEDEDVGLAKALEMLDHAQGASGRELLELAGRLAAERECTIPVLQVEPGDAEIVDEVTYSQWQ